MQMPTSTTAPCTSLRLNTTSPTNTQDFDFAPVDPKTGKLVPIFSSNGTNNKCGANTPYVCEHRFVPTTAMVQFRNAAGDSPAQVNVRDLARTLAFAALLSS